VFGFVKAYKPELRIKEYEMYKAVYCTICKQIGKEYGFVSRFTLSYDFTFFMLLYLSLREDCLSPQKGKCIYNPAKACNYIKEKLPKMPLAAAQIMLYFKLKDNIEDEGALRSFGAKSLKALSKKGYKKAANEFPEINGIFEEYYTSQLKLEQKNTSNLDLAAEPTAIMLSKLFSLCSNGGENRALGRLGYCLGRWIYILDVAADLEEDITKGKFNPLKKEAEEAENLREFIIKRLETTLNFCISEAAAAFELIDIKRFKNILGNIIYLGLENSQNEILKKEKCKK
jgi:hypothetical protein